MGCSTEDQFTEDNLISAEIRNTQVQAFWNAKFSKHKDKKITELECTDISNSMDEKKSRIKLYSLRFTI